ncbi:MAG: hypothetical protein AAF968_00045 [Pseudomonadota bacterium]
MRVGGENNWGKNPIRVRDLRRKLFFLFVRHDQLKSEGQREGAMKSANLGRNNVRLFLDESLGIRSPSDAAPLASEIEQRLISERRSDTRIDLEVFGAHLNSTKESIKLYQHIKLRTSFINQAYFASILGFPGFKGGNSKQDQLAYVVMSNIVHARVCESIADCGVTCTSMCEASHRALEFSCSPPTQQGPEPLRYTFAPARALPRIARAFGFNKTWIDGEEDYFNPATWDGEWQSDFNLHRRAWQAFAGECTTTVLERGVEEVVYGDTLNAFITAHKEMMSNGGPREMKAHEGSTLLARRSGSSKDVGCRRSSARPATDNLFRMDVFVGQSNEASAPLLLRQLVVNPGVIAPDDAPPVIYAASQARLRILPEHALHGHLSFKGVPTRVKIESSVTVDYNATAGEMELIASASPGRCLPVVSLFNDDVPFLLAEVGVGAEPGSGLEIDLRVRRCDVRAIAAHVDVNDLEGPVCELDAPMMPAEGFDRLLAEAEAEGRTRSDKLHSVLSKRVLITLSPSVDDNDWRPDE